MKDKLLSFLFSVSMIVSPITVGIIPVYVVSEFTNENNRIKNI